MSACFAFGLAAGEPIKALSAAAGTGPLWTGLPALCLIMFGGLITNAVWCGFLIVRNRTAGEFVGLPGKAPDADGRRPPRHLNYLLPALGATLGSEERPGGSECVSLGRCWWASDHIKKTN